MRVLGAVLILAVLGTFFVMSAQFEGWKVATLVWLASLAITGVVVLGAFLLAGWSW